MIRQTANCHLPKGLAYAITSYILGFIDNKPNQNIKISRRILIINLTRFDTEDGTEYGADKSRINNEG